MRWRHTKSEIFSPLLLFPNLSTAFTRRQSNCSNDFMLGCTFSDGLVLYEYTEGQVNDDARMHFEIVTLMLEIKFFKNTLN